MRPLILSLLFATTVTVANAQVPLFDWARSTGGPLHDDGSGVTVDAAGNVYTTGSFQGTVDMDPGAGVFNLTAVGSSDIFVTKLDAAGNFVWSKSMGGDFYDEGRAIAVDGSGNVYTTGDFSPGANSDFDPGTGVFSLPLHGTNYDIFVSKLDADGNFVWAVQLGGSDNEIGYDIALDAAHNSYITGLTWSAGLAVEVAKLDADGNLTWERNLMNTVQGGISSVGTAIAADASGNVYTTGYFAGTMDFDPGAGTYDLSSGHGAFVSKLNAAGNFVWAKMVSSNAVGGVSGYGIAVDASNNVITTGSFQGTADMDPGTGTAELTALGVNVIFVSKLDAAGNFVWAKSMDGMFCDAIAFSLALDADGGIYTTGQFHNTIDFDPGTGTAPLTAPGGYDIFISKLDASGNYDWATSIGGTLDDMGNSIAVDGQHNLYVAGTYNGSMDFDPGQGTTLLWPVGASDAFVLKLGQGTTGIGEQAALPGITLYPNPAAKSATIKLDHAASMEVHDDLGRLMFSANTVGRTEYPLSLAGYSPGIYLVSVRSLSGLMADRTLVVQ